MDATKPAGRLASPLTEVLGLAPPDDEHPYTYASTQATNCACCGEYKHTPLRIDAMGGYVCLTCIDRKLGTLLCEFGYPAPQEPLTDEQLAALVLSTVYEGDASTPHRDAWAAEIGIPFARAIEQEHGIRPNVGVEPPYSVGSNDGLGAEVEHAIHCASETGNMGARLPRAEREDGNDRCS